MPEQTHLAASVLSLSDNEAMYCRCNFLLRSTALCSTYTTKHKIYFTHVPVCLGQIIAL
jgi:hypothetical protein